MRTRSLLLFLAEAAVRDGWSKKKKPVRLSVRGTHGTAAATAAAFYPPIVFGFWGFATAATAQCAGYTMPIYHAVHVSSSSSLPLPPPPPPRRRRP
jgi:hypothetical protein